MGEIVDEKRRLTTKWIRSSAKSPCPVCDRTKDGDCRISEDEGLVLCHSEVNTRVQGERVGEYIWIGSTENYLWGKWIKPGNQPTKNPAYRPPDQKFQFPYTDETGAVVCTKVRVYQKQADGSVKKKDWWEPKGVKNENLLPYRYLDAIAALKENPDLPLLIDESELTADELWKLGLPAIAFGRSIQNSRIRKLLSGYEDRLVVCVDRDKPGVKKASRYLKLFPMAKQLKPYPESAFWEPEWLPDSGGLDVRDWVLENQLTSAQVLSEVVQPDLSPEQSYEATSEKPIVQLQPGQMTTILDQIEVLLGSCPEPRDRIYVQGTPDGFYLSRLLKAKDIKQTKVLIELPAEGDTLDILTSEGLLYELNKRFQFQRHDKRLERSQPCDCPKAIATQFLAKGRWPGLSQLTGITYIPLLLKDGTVLTQPGYYDATGTLLQFDPEEFPQIPQTCTQDHAIAALEILEDWLKEFPFQKPEHKSAALSAVLTAISRRLLKQAPLHALSATKAGTGKGTFVKGVSTLVLGGHPGVIPWTGETEEFRKKMTSFLRSGSPIGSIDNVTGILGGDVLEMVLTEPFFKDRLLGSNQMPNFSTQVTLIANGNNLRFRPDMTRRTILCVLDAECENPEHRAFERDFEDYTETNRGKLVMAAITVLKAYLDAGSPHSVTPRLGSFGQWSDLVRSALVWLGQTDPVLTQQELSAQDDEKQLLSALMTVWNDQYGSTSRTAREVISWAMSQGSGDLKDVLIDICLDRNGDLSPRRLGNYLRVHHRSVVDGLRFEAAGKDRTNQVRWQLMQIK